MKDCHGRLFEGVLVNIHIDTIQCEIAGTATDYLPCPIFEGVDGAGGRAAEGTVSRLINVQVAHIVLSI